MPDPNDPSSYLSPLADFQPPAPGIPTGAVPDGTVPGLGTPNEFGVYVPGGSDEELRRQQETTRALTERAALEGRQLDTTAVDPAPPPAASPAVAPESFDPTLMRQLAGMGRTRQPTAGGGGVRAARQDLDTATAQRQTAEQAAQAQLRSQAAAAHAAGQSEAARLQGVHDKALEISEQHAAERKAAEAERDERINAWQTAAKEQYDIANSAQDRGRLLKGIGPALGAALGAMGSALTGGPNAYFAVVDRRIAEEAAEQKRMLQAAGLKTGNAKSAIGLAYDKLQDVDAAEQATVSQLYRASAVAAQRHAAITGSDEKRANYLNAAEQLNMKAAAHEEAVARQVYDQRLRARRAAAAANRPPSLKEQLELEGKALSNEKARRELESGGAEGGGKLDIPADTQKRINSAQLARRQYEEIIAAAERLKKEGHEYVPGREGLRDIPEKLVRGASRLPGLGNVIEHYTDRGPEGMTEDQKLVANMPMMAGISKYQADTGQVADREAERDLIRATAYGSGTLDSVISSARRNLEAMKDAERKLMEQHDPALSQQLQRNRAQNPLPQVPTWEGAARQLRDRATPPPVPGATRAGR